MNPDRLRRLDRLLGVPLCALLTLCRRLRTAFETKRAEPPPRRMLFMLLAEAGSIVLAGPAIRAAAARGAEAWFVTLAHNAAAVALTGAVPPERVFRLRCGSFGELLADVWRLRRWRRRNDLDTVVDFELFARLSAVLAWWTGARRRVGFHADEGGALYRGRLYSAPVRFNPHQHIAKNYLRLVAVAFDGPAAAARPLSPRALQMPTVAPTPEALARVEALLGEVLAPPCGRLVLVNPNASERLPQRRWPAENFAEMIELLMAIRPDVSVVLIGGEEDRATTAGIRARVDRARCVDIAGRLPIDALPALFTRSALLVSNDSGPAHFAAASALPVVVLFGPETPTLFRPLGPATIISASLSCSPCVSPANQRKSTCLDNQCMQRIAVATVVDASLRMLALYSARRTVPQKQGSVR